MIKLSDEKHYDTMTPPAEDRIPFLRGDAEYTLEVTALYAHHPTTPGSSDAIMFEGKILDVTGTDALAAGSRGAYRISVGMKYSWEKEFRALVATIFGVPFEDVDRATLEGVLKQDPKVIDAMKGRKIKARSFEARKKDGSPVTTKKGEQIFNAKFSAVEQ